MLDRQTDGWGHSRFVEMMASWNRIDKVHDVKMTFYPEIDLYLNIKYTHDNTELYLRILVQT